MPFDIRAVTPADENAWRHLWQQYCAFYQVTLDERITARTWERIIEHDTPMYALIAMNATGEPIGICNYVCHLNTWSDQTVCYLEDLFVAASGRRQGLATAFIDKLLSLGRSENWKRVYWITNHENTAAQATYDALAKRTGHIRYEITLNASTPAALSDLPTI